jgi:protein gp37
MQYGPREPQWTGRVELVPEKLAEPLSWRKPARVCVNSMSDLFHESLPDEAIAAVFGVMAVAPWHTFQVLTKRAERMRRWFEWASDPRRGGALTVGRKLNLATHEIMGGRAPSGAAIENTANETWPLPNVHLGVSVENQETADERIPHLLATPAALRFLSCEPLLGAVDLRWCEWCGRFGDHDCETSPEVGIDWVIVGGESGPGARLCDVAWIRSIVEQCKAAGVPVFVKQLGARPIATAAPLASPQSAESIMRHGEYDPDPIEFRFRDRKGGDPSEWPEDLRRVREMPR